MLVCIATTANTFDEDGLQVPEARRCTLSECGPSFTAPLARPALVKIASARVSSGEESARGQTMRLFHVRCSRNPTPTEGGQATILQKITGQTYESYGNVSRSRSTMYETLPFDGQGLVCEAPEPAQHVQPAPDVVPWRLLFALEWNDRMRGRLLGYARRVAASIAEAGGAAGDACAEDLLHECIEATFSGELTWDPSATSLEPYLRSRLRARGRDERRRALQRPTRSIDEGGEEGDKSSALDEAEAALEGLREQDPEAAAALLLHLEEESAGDDEVRAILEAAHAGAAGKAQILEATGLSEKAYRNARLRLRRLGDRFHAE